MEIKSTKLVDPRKSSIERYSIDVINAIDEEQEENDHLNDTQFEQDSSKLALVKSRKFGTRSMIDLDILNLNQVVDQAAIEDVAEM